MFTAPKFKSEIVGGEPRKLSNIEKAKICGVLPQSLPLMQTRYTKALGNMVPER